MKDYLLDFHLDSDYPRDCLTPWHLDEVGQIYLDHSTLRGHTYRFRNIILLF